MNHKDWDSMTPQQKRALRPLLTNNPLGFEYHAARVAKAPVAVSGAYIAIGMAPAMIAFCGLCRIAELASKAVRRSAMVQS